MALVVTLLIFQLFLFDSIFLFLPNTAFGANLKCEIDPKIQNGYNYKASENPTVDGPILGTIGDLNDVLNGVLKDSVKDKEWSSSDSGKGGIGAANLGDWAATGEVVFVNGLTVIRSTNNGSKDFYKTLIGPKFKTQLSTFILKDAQPDGVFTAKIDNIHSQESLELSDFYVKIYQQVKKPFCYLGLAQFQLMKSIAMNLAPIYNEPIFGEKHKNYYANPVKDLTDIHALIVGCTANYTDMDSALAKEMSKFVYVNPLGLEKEGCKSHSHALILKRCVSTVKEVGEAEIAEVYHILAQSKIQLAKVEVYAVKGLESIKVMGKGKDGGSGNSNAGSNQNQNQFPSQSSKGLLFKMESSHSQSFGNKSSSASQFKQKSSFSQSYVAQN